MMFPPSAGCSMCSIVSRAVHGPRHSPRSDHTGETSSQNGPEIMWRDDNFTVYRETAHPVARNGHIIVAFNLHIPGIYTLSSTDLPLLVALRALATRQLHTLGNTTNMSDSNKSSFRIGFITPPFKDNKIPVSDHLHAHAYIAPANLLGWWRGMAYGPLSWYDVNDLIAEIRESVSNNRIKSGYENRGQSAIDLVPSAGARTGTADGMEFSRPALGRMDSELECGDSSPMHLLDSQILARSQTPRINI